VRRSKFLTTGRMIRIFSQQCKEPQDGDRVVYIDGAWDMFHSGHVETLKAARELGAFLIVGVHNDDLVNAHRGLLVVAAAAAAARAQLDASADAARAACRHQLPDHEPQRARAVGVGPPWDITREMIAALKISVVATGTTRDCSYGMDESKYYQVPRAMGLLRTVKSNATITVEDIVERILSQEAVYQLKLKKKTKAENEYYSDRFGFDVTKPEDQVSPSLTPPLLKI
jgi:ethanolamine-phosphate cytidylyltransferase